MPITYDPTTNTVTITGGTEDNPYTFEDIYNADVANGWGVFTKLSEGVYKTTAKLRFGDSVTETWFKDYAVTLIVDNVSDVNLDHVISFSSNANVSFGIKEVSTYVNYSNGVTFIIHNTLTYSWFFNAESGSNVNFYGCVIKLTKDTVRHDISGYYNELKGCLFECVVTRLANTNVQYCTFIGKFGYLENVLEGCILNKIYIKTTQDWMLYISNYNIVFKEIYGSSNDLLAKVYRLLNPNVAKFVNCKPMNWKVSWYLASGDVSGELHRIYTVTFKVTDVDGNPLQYRVVKVYNKNGDLIAEVETDENGLTPETEILYAKLVNPYADDTWHTFTDEDWEYFNPFIVEVWYGNELEYKGILTDLDVESTFIQITVKPSSFTLDDIFAESEKIRKYLTNRWKIENNQLIIYDDDGVTPILKFNLYDKFGNPTEINVYERKPTQ